VSAFEIERDDERDRIGAGIRRISRLNPSLLARPISVSSIEDLIVENDDRLPQPVLSNISAKSLELGALKERKYLG
jgi:hypothetical protein